MEKKEDDNLYWFVAIVTPNTEIKAKERLDALSTYWKNHDMMEKSETITAYVPIRNEWRVQPGTCKRVKVQKVLTPCYLFIQCRTPIRYKIACEAKFILHFLMNRAKKLKSGNSDFARIPNEQMDKFIRMVGESGEEVAIETSRLRVGSKVRIKTGSLSGLEGNIYRDPNGATMLAIRVDFLGYAKMQCSKDNLELIEE